MLLTLVTCTSVSDIDDDWPGECRQDAARMIRRRVGIDRSVNEQHRRPDLTGPWSDRRGPLDALAPWPCLADPLKMTSEPAGPHANACPSCAASDMVSAGV